jgi:hypothetical protein
MRHTAVTWLMQLGVPKWEAAETLIGSSEEADQDAASPERNEPAG